MLMKSASLLAQIDGRSIGSQSLGTAALRTIVFGLQACLRPTMDSQGPRFIGRGAHGNVVMMTMMMMMMSTVPSLCSCSTLRRKP